MRILSVGRAFPEHYYNQGQLLEALRRHWAREHFNPARLERLHKNVAVSGRYMSLSMDEYEDLETWGQANDVWIRVAVEVAEQAIQKALHRSGVLPNQIGVLFSTTVTGLAVPSVDALLMNRLPFNPHMKRVPLFGLGCVAGAAGIARAADYVRAFPDQAALLVAVELCSLTVQKQDLTIPNLIATGLFGDGAAAVLVAGEEFKAASERAEEVPESSLVPVIQGTRSVFYPDTERMMGWDISERGFQIVLSAGVPSMVEDHLRSDVDTFLAEHGLDRSRIRTWICHPGGPKVLEALQTGLELPEDALSLTWESLRKVGNLSSASVLMILEDTLEQIRNQGGEDNDKRVRPGDYALLLAMGPGFCSELVLLKMEEEKAL